MYHGRVAPRVMIVVLDLMFEPRIRAAAEALGAETTTVVTDAEADAALGSGAALVVVDVHAAGVDVARLISAAKGASASVLAFGRHTEPATLRAARAAGADRVVPRSQLVEELPELIAAMLPSPPPKHV
jgi:DNA-binding NarL/FixJ family response regulator